MSGEVNFTPIDWADVHARQTRSARVDSALQIGIAVLSIVSMFLLASTGPWQRWGYIVGLSGQPLWFVSTWRTGQYGIFIVSLFYTAALALGAFNRFSF